MDPHDRALALRGAIATIGTHPVAWLRGRLWHSRFNATQLREEAIRSNLQPGQSFLDVGAMWRVDGACSFFAERLGAGAVTALDVMAPTPGFVAAHRSHDSRVVYVNGDINQPDTVTELQPHDVVWCAGVLYHSPDPFRTLRHLRRVTGKLLLLATEVVPDRRMQPPSAVVLATKSSHPGAPHSRPSDVQPGDYGPWYLLPTPRAVRLMLEATSFQVVSEVAAGPFHRLFVARRTSAGP